MISPVEVLTADITGLGSNMTIQLLSEWQLGRIRDTLSYVKKRSPFYSKHLAEIDESQIRTFTNIENIPFTTQQNIIDSSSDFLCVPNKEVSRIRTFMTSGSTAKAKRIYFTGNDIERTVSFFAHGMTTMVSSGEKVVIMMSDGKPGSIADLLQKGLDRVGVSSKIHGNIADVETAASDASKAQCIVGMPSEINYLCVTHPSLRPTSVLLSADYAPESIINKIQKNWHCKVFTHYGMTETCYGCAVQCTEESGHHIRHEDMFLEIIDPADGSPVPAGCEGEIVITVFANEAMPLIRYRTGDIGSIVVDKCTCGSVLPRLSKVKGRLNNIIEISSGISISIEQLDEIICGIDTVRTYNAELDLHSNKKTLSLIIDSYGGLDREKIIQHIRESIPEEITIEVNFETLAPSQWTRKRHIKIIQQ